jgi:hypothetical protein
MAARLWPVVADGGPITGIDPLLPVVNDRFETTKIDSIACETHLFGTHVDSSA